MRFFGVYSSATYEKGEGGGGTSTIKVFIHNATRDEARLFIGLKGTSRHGVVYPISAVQTKGPLQVRHGIGTPAIPRLRFVALEIAAPIVRFSGTTDGNRTPTVIVLEPGAEIEYYRFVVPTEWILDQFNGGEIDFPAGARSKKTVSVPIMRFGPA